MKLSTRQIVIAGVMIAVALVLAFTGLGYFPVPNVSDSATIMHVPVIIGALLAGPIAGVVVSLVFAIDAYFRFAFLFVGSSPLLQLLILLVPRLFVGLGAWLAYNALKGRNEILALAMGGIAGTLTNTVLVVGLALLFFDQIQFFRDVGLTRQVFFASVIPQAIFESVLAAIVTVAVVAAWKRLDTGRGGSSV
jgi:uncharacterized membrane protein